MTAEARHVATPVRALASQLDGQVVRLRSTELAYLDGGEESVTALLREWTDLSSLSDELALKGDTWAE